MKLLSLFLILMLFGCASVPRPSGESVVESYELLFVPTFETPDHFFIEKTADGYFISRQYYQGQGGYDYRKFQSPKTKYLYPYQWEAATEIIYEGHFWKPSVKDTQDFLVLDSYTVTLTGQKDEIRKTIEQYGDYSDFLFPLHERLVFLWEKGRTKP